MLLLRKSNIRGALKEMKKLRGRESVQEWNRECTTVFRAFEYRMCADGYGHCIALSQRKLSNVNSQTLTYEEMQRRIRREVAPALREQGVAAGERVAVVASNIVENELLMYAINALGATYIPGSVKEGAHQHSYILRDAKPSLLIVEHAGQVREFRP